MYKNKKATKRDKQNMNIGYKMFQLIFKVLLVLLFRWEVFGIKNIPDSKGGLIACNHNSFLDPPLAGTAIKRPVYYLAKDSLYKNAFAKWFIDTCHGIPIKRNTIDRNNINRVVDLIRKKHFIVMFPEGTRSKDGKISKGKPGIGLIAWQTKCTVIPCYIDGSAKALGKGSGLLKPTKIKVYYGEQLDLLKLYEQQPSKEVFQEIANSIIEAIKKLKEEHTK